METIPVLLENRLREALASFGGGEAKVQPINDVRFGDYQTNVAMVMAKAQKANPRQLAQQIIDKLNVAEICDAEIAGPGFINFRLKLAWLTERFITFANDDRVGVPQQTRPKQLVVDFSSPNVAKPMHVGHIRSTILGDALARIAEFVGHKVVRDNHIGDWGTQFGMLLLGWKTELDPKALEADPIGEMERIYRKISPQCSEEKPEFNPEVRDRARQELVKLQSGDAENLALWKEMIRLSEKQFDQVYGRLGIRFDFTLGESFYNPRLKDVVEQLRTKGIAQESKGAMCVFSDGSVAQEQDPFFIKDKEGWHANPALVQKSDGAANYTTTDLATLQYRTETWQPDEIIYVTDGRQQLHFRQFFAIFRRWHPEISVRLAHVWFGSILGEDNKPFKTRSGDTVKLADLLDEAEERAYAIVTEKNPALSEEDRREIGRIIGLGAVKYADLLPNRQSDYVFSWDKMLSFQGNTAPYLQNAYVRICGIFRKAAANAAGGEAEASQPLSNGRRAPVPSEVVLTEPAELALVKKLYQFAETLPMVLDDYRPNLLCNYLYELAAMFHNFFEACPVLKAGSDASRASRLALCDATARVLAKGLELLGIEVPERM